MIIITGCPKSGTQYTALTLLAMGLDVRHERIGMEGVVDWRMAPYKKEKPKNIYLHQIREPLATMTSCQKIASYAWDYIAKFIDIKDKPLLEKILTLYYEWNLCAEYQTDYSYKVEYLPAIFQVFCDKIRHPELKEKYHILTMIPNNINTAKPYKKLTWKRLEKVNKEMTKKVQQMAHRYGYRY